MYTEGEEIFIWLKNMTNMATQNITYRARLPEKLKVNNAGHQRNDKNNWMLTD